jgi:hypothetical protein
LQDILQGGEKDKVKDCALVPKMHT